MEYLEQKYSLQNYLSKIQYIFFVLFVLFIPFQDCGLQGTFLRYFGANLSNIPLMVVIFISIFKFLLGEKVDKKVFVFYTSISIYIIGYSLLVTISYINDSSIGFYLYKILSNSIIFIFWLFAYIYAKKYADNIGKYIIGANIIHIIGWILCDILKLDLGKGIHYAQVVDYSRFHGFTLEASYFCFTAVLLGILSIYYIKNKFIKFIFGIFVLVFVICGGSKGTMVCIFISIIIYILLSKKYRIVTKIILLVISLLISFLGFYYILLNAFFIDLEESTSFASRVSSILSVFYILQDYPLGTGLGTFLPVFQISITKAFDLLNEYIPGIVLAYKEIDNWISNERGEGAVIRSIVFQYIAYFGIPFLLGFIYYVKYMIKNIFKDKYTWLFIFILCGLLTFAGFNYDSIIVLALISQRINMRKME